MIKCLSLAIIIYSSIHFSLFISLANFLSLVSPLSLFISLSLSGSVYTSLSFFSLKLSQYLKFRFYIVSFSTSLDI